MNGFTPGAPLPDGTVDATDPGDHVPPPPVEWIERTYPEDDADVETDTEVEPVPVALSTEETGPWA